MTQSPTTPTPKQISSQPAPGPVRSLLILIFRLLLLGIGGVVASLLGMAIAQFYPAQLQQEPLSETLLRRSSDLVNGFKSMAQPTPIATPSPPAATANRPVSPSLEPPVGQPETIPPAIATTSQANLLGITLPSAALFEADQTTLRPEASTILDNLINDAQRYPGAAIRVAGHTDSSDPLSAESSQRNRAYSFAQAQAVERYLANQLGDQHHWVIAGYGETRPLVTNDTPINRQRNRRIEITIEP